MASFLAWLECVHNAVERDRLVYTHYGCGEGATTAQQHRHRSEIINDIEAALKLTFSQVKWSFFEPDTADQCAPRRIGSSFAVAALPRQ
jgi:hypothetical protein